MQCLCNTGWAGREYERLHRGASIANACCASSISSHPGTTYLHIVPKHSEPSDLLESRVPSDTIKRPTAQDSVLSRRLTTTRRKHAEDMPNPSLHVPARRRQVGTEQLTEQPRCLVAAPTMSLEIVRQHAVVEHVPNSRWARFEVCHETRRPRRRVGDTPKEADGSGLFSCERRGSALAKAHNPSQQVV